jgi:hypothetical protein
MKIWTTGIYWNQQKRYCTVMIYFTLELVWAWDSWLELWLIMEASELNCSCQY